MFKGIILAAAISCSGAMGYMSDINLIKDGEGYSQCTYVDSVGIKTVCYGFNLQRGNSKKEVNKAGGDYNVLIEGGCANSNVCNRLLDVEVKAARGFAQK